jgi:hypothetical protein
MKHEFLTRRFGLYAGDVDPVRRIDRGKRKHIVKAQRGDRALDQRLDADSREPDAAEILLLKKAEEATEPQLVRMLIEIGLLRSGYSGEKLEPTDALIRAAAHSKKKRQPAKCASRKTHPPRNKRTASVKKSTRRGGAG